MRKIILSALLALILISGPLACGEDENVVGCVNDIVVEADQFWLCDVTNMSSDGYFSFYEDGSGFVIFPEAEFDSEPIPVTWTLDEEADTVDQTIIAEDDLVLLTNVCTSGSGVDRTLSFQIEPDGGGVDVADCVIVDAATVPGFL